MSKKNTKFYCRSCGNTDFDNIIDLGDQAWCNNFLSKAEIGQEKTYPLKMVRCVSCELCQLDTTVSKEVMFKNHSYVSGTTKTLRNHFLEVAQENKEALSLKEDDVIWDIGGNDGTQLLQYSKLNFKKLLNIESATNISELSIANGIPTRNTFFNELTVKDEEESSVKLINAAGVFFHLEELHSVIAGIKKAMREDGVFVVQFMYLGDMIQKLSFDGIYHEHLCYYSLKSLMNLLEPYGLTIFDGYHSDIHGGSMIAKFCKNKKYKQTCRIKDLISQDEDFVNKDNLIKFSSTVADWRDNFTSKILDIKKNGNKIYAFGAPAKGNTLLTYCGLNKNIIDYIFEVNDMKCNLYTPVTHIPIIKENDHIIEENSYVILLSWNFFDEIVDKHQHLIDSGVKFIHPFKDI
jgi:hypothetical protein